MERITELAALVLAAGQGTRMKSRLPKVLHPLCGLPMLEYPLRAAEALGAGRLCVVVAPGADALRGAFEGRAEFVVQPEARGTGHAVLQCREALADFSGEVLILYGDTPLLQGKTLAALSAHRQQTGADLVLLSAEVDVPGIVIRAASGAVERVVEATDASPEQLEVRERNTGVYLLGADLLWKLLAQVDDQNAQGEIYLTDIVELAVREGCRVEALRVFDADEALGVNSRKELARATGVLQRRILERLMEEGVTIVDPANTYIDSGVRVGRDSVIEAGCTIQGDSNLGEGVHLKPGCTIESSRVGDDVQIGPNAHLRPDCVIGDGCRIGNFVEVKNSTLGEGTKADHLSYIGDADVGKGASFGCGSVVVNYDGVKKHRCQVGDRAFVGCNVNLIAPVVVEADSYVAAGSTITQTVPSDALAVARARQRNIEGWVSRRGRRRS
ncbi:MAG: bifunctional UDP-N-acetylglucosamine diphosphorylase/glucosamine-1-phosphate N-acetyltransferase GlmU [Myxococcota bacterium]